MAFSPPMAKKRRSRLTQFMRRTETTDNGLAKELGVHATTVYRIRTRRVAPSGPTIRRLLKWSQKTAEARGIPPLSVEEILGI